MLRCSFPFCSFLDLVSKVCVATANEVAIASVATANESVSANVVTANEVARTIVDGTVRKIAKIDEVTRRSEMTKRSLSQISSC